MTDPYADGTPAGDDHTWVQPQPAPCPTCECCTADLCQQAKAATVPCELLGDPGLYPRYCPCPSLGVAAQYLRRAVDADPDRPGAAPMGAVEADERYRIRAGNLIAGAKAAIHGGLNAGVCRDLANPDSPVLLVDLPTGQVSWHMPRIGEDPDPVRYYVCCGLPVLDVAAWDVTGLVGRYRRLDAWLSAVADGAK